MPSSITTPVTVSRPLPAVSTLSKEMLRKRLRELSDRERALQVDFLLHLSEFDRRKCYLDAGHGSLWSYCLRELHLREGPAARRIGAMRVLRQYPELEEPLRDGRLCMSTLTMIAPLLADHDVLTLVSRAAYLTKAEVEHLVATLRPVAAPRDGVRLITSQPATQRGSAAGPEAFALGAAASADSPTLTIPPDAAGRSGATDSPDDTGTKSAPPEPSAGAQAAVAATALALNVGPAASASSRTAEAPWCSPDATATVPKSERARAELRPVAAEQWSLRVTMDAAMKNDLETLESLLSHSLGGDLTSIVREALRCAVEKHGKRRGALAPVRNRPAPMPAKEQGSVGRNMMEGAPEMIGAEHAAVPARGATPARSERPTPGPQPLRPPVNAARPPRAISAAVRREVWARDGGCCSWRGRDGRRCGSRWKVEIDHIHPVALGGRPTVGNLRLLCRSHNVRHAENVFGRRHMSKFGARNDAAPGGAPAARNDAHPGGAPAPNCAAPGGAPAGRSDAAPGGAPTARNDADGAGSANHTPPVDELALGSVLPGRDR